MKPFSDEYFNNLACMILNQKFNLNLEDRKKITGTDDQICMIQRNLWVLK